MSNDAPISRDSFLRTGLLICGRFLLIVPLCLVLWLCLMPAYTWLLGHSAAFVLRVFLGEAISAVKVLPAGILNTDTALVYVLPERSATMAGIGHLVANVAPFLAIVLATPAPWRRRLRAIGIGLPVLGLLHVATIVLRFEAGRTTLPTVTGFIAVTLPFLLWIVLLFWDQLERK